MLFIGKPFFVVLFIFPLWWGVRPPHLHFVLLSSCGKTNNEPCQTYTKASPFSCGLLLDTETLVDSQSLPSIVLGSCGLWPWSVWACSWIPTLQLCHLALQHLLARTFHGSYSLSLFRLSLHNQKQQIIHYFFSKKKSTNIHSQYNFYTMHLNKDTKWLFSQWISPVVQNKP